MSVTASGSLDADSVASYLRNKVSGSIVYLLTLVQPLTTREIESNPYRAQYLSMMPGKGRGDSNLSRIVREGVDSGVLIGYGTRRENYYFLNSDIGIRPPPLQEGGEAEIALEFGGGQVNDEIILPASTSLSKDHPIPLLQDPSTCLGWFDWLSNDRKRAILLAIEEHGPLTRHELAETGVRVETASIEAGVRIGVLRLRNERLEFQFAKTRLPPHGNRWTARPPRFWFTRSLESLRCINGSEEYLAKVAEKSPAQLLQEMSEDGRKVVPSRRRGHLTVNFLYEPSAVVPRLEEVGPGTISALWENRRGLLWTVRDGFERAEAALSIQEEMGLLKDDRGASRRGRALEALAKRKMVQYLKARERELLEGDAMEGASGYSLGTTALLSVANIELARDKIREERRYFERFLAVISQDEPEERSPR